jgi:hypothetical protein
MENYNEIQVKVKRTEYSNKINIQIELLKANLREYNKQNKKTDWGVVGSLAHIHEQLKELNQFFGK